MKPLRKYSTLLGAAAVFAAVAAVYLAGIRPAIWYSDPGEFAVSPGFLAPGHYPGYPLPNQLLYLPHLVARNPVYYAGALNALWGAAAAAGAFVAWRLLGVRVAVAAACALAFAFTFANWEAATTGPEVYTLETLAGAVVLALTCAAVTRDDGRYLAAAAFVFALALGDRNSFVLFLPLLVAAAFAGRRPSLALAAAVLVLGASVYLHFILRSGCFGDQVPGSGLPSGHRFIDYHLSFKKLSFYGGLAQNDRRAVSYIISHLIFEAKHAGVILAAAGAVLFGWRDRRRRRFGVGLIASLALFLALFITYVAVPVEPYLLLPLLLAFTLIAWGAERLIRLAARVRVLAAALAAVTFLLPAYNFARHRTVASHGGERSCVSFVEEQLRLVRYKAALYGEHFYFMPHCYYHFILRARPDVAYQSLNANDFHKLVAARPASFGVPYGEKGLTRRPAAPAPYWYFTNTYPDIGATPGIITYDLRTNFLARGLAALEPGGRFVAVGGDARAAAFARLLNQRPEWRIYSWREPGRDLPLVWNIGTGLLLVGKREGPSLVVNGVVYWGARRARWVCPRDLYPPPPYAIDFAFRGDAPYGLNGLSLALGERRYELPSSGIIFVPLTAAWRPAGPARFYYAHVMNSCPLYELPNPALAPSP
jgi:hypothetical protein